MITGLLDYDALIKMLSRAIAVEMGRAASCYV